MESCHGGLQQVTQGEDRGWTSQPRGRPSTVAHYAPQVTQWLREDADLSGAEILRRVRLAGYRGGKSALYELVRRLYKAGKLAGLMLGSALLLASPALAGEKLAGAGTVEEWRTRLGRSELATAAYAAGVVATSSVFTECKNPRTVRELHT